MGRSIKHLVAALSLSLLLAGCSLLPSGRSAQIADDEATPTPIPTSIALVKPTYRVQVGEIVKELSFNGRVSPVIEEGLFFRTNGRIRSVYAKRGDLVEAGQVLADLEIENLEREMTSARLNLERAQSRLESAQRELDFAQRSAQVNLDIANLRLLELMRSEDENSVVLSVQRKQIELAQIALDRLSAGVDPLLENDVARAQLEVEKLENAIADATVTAPFDGQILSLSLSPGRPVEAYAEVVAIAQTEELEVKADLVSDQMEELEEGMEVSIFLPNRPGELLSGIVRQLPYPYGSGGGGATVEELDKSTRISLNESPEDAGYEMGDLVRIVAQLENRQDVLWLPPQAIRTFDGRRFVVVEDGEVQRRVDVTLGIQTADRAEIVDGLEEGQTVVGQ